MLRRHEIADLFGGIRGKWALMEDLSGERWAIPYGKVPLEMAFTGHHWGGTTLIGIGYLKDMKGYRRILPSGVSVEPEEDATHRLPDPPPRRTS